VFQETRETVADGAIGDQGHLGRLGVGHPVDVHIDHDCLRAGVQRAEQIEDGAPTRSLGAHERRGQRRVVGAQAEIAISQGVEAEIGSHAVEPGEKLAPGP
jgi:hypothetical protein